MSPVEQIILRKLQRIEDMLWIALKLEVKQMASIDDLVAEVQDESTVVAGVSKLMDRLIADLNSARGDQAKIDSILASAQANKAALADAVARGTAADPEVGPTGATGPTGPAQSGPSGPADTGASGPAESGASGAAPAVSIHDQLANPQTTGDVGTEASAGTSGNVQP